MNMPRAKELHHLMSVLEMAKDTAPDLRRRALNERQRLEVAIRTYAKNNPRELREWADELQERARRQNVNLRGQPTALQAAEIRDVLERAYSAQSGLDAAIASAERVRGAT